MKDFEAGVLGGGEPPRRRGRPQRSAAEGKAFPSLQSLIHFLNFVFVVGRKRNPENYVDYNEDAEPDEGAWKFVWEPAAQKACDVHNDACDYEMEDGEEFEGVCYNNPDGGAEVFSSI